LTYFNHCITCWFDKRDLNGEALISYKKIGNVYVYRAIRYFLAQNHQDSFKMFFTFNTVLVKCIRFFRWIAFRLSETVNVH